MSFDIYFLVQIFILDRFFRPLHKKSSLSMGPGSRLGSSPNVKPEPSKKPGLGPNPSIIDKKNLIVLLHGRSAVFSGHTLVSTFLKNVNAIDMGKIQYYSISSSNAL